ncbi:hypothetical protein KP509_06G064200 [Ceratopteris richardii]|uniref:Uncharacterized protein n=1 Tax=Ceratopteris richardii TaxID=49495 RepID=A0A8T2ULJ8_CERRI|nr:hypothetical protein KP509_06G064200 [Ceratopteris richardii]KAH7435420.1 hypothetical protein KP509_06G064200 [Ceratopteris richardii]
MASSAFKSTTRRWGAQGIPNDRDKGDPVRVSSDKTVAHEPKPKYRRRRSSRLSDTMPNPRLQDDSSSQCRADQMHRFLEQQLSESVLAKSKQVEDVNCSPSDRKHIDETTHRLVCPQVNVHVDSSTRTKSQRSSSVHGKSLRDPSEGQVEEKIIQAIHAQSKPIKRPRNLSGDQNDQCIQSIICDALSDMREMIEMTQEKASVSGSSMHDPFNAPYISLIEEIVKMIRSVMDDRAEKLEKAEEEIRLLRTQLAEKDQYLQLAISEKDQSLETTEHWKREALSLKKDSYELYSKQITCSRRRVIRTLSTGSLLDDEETMQRLSALEILSSLQKEQGETLQLIQASPSANYISYQRNGDGLVLPWLALSEEVSNTVSKVNQENAGQTLEGFSDKAEPSCQEDGKEHNGTEDHISQEPCQTQEHSLSVLGNGSCKTAAEWIAYKVDASASHACIADSSLLYIQSTELISQRIEFRARIEAGELLLCIGALHIH